MNVFAKRAAALALAGAALVAAGSGAQAALQPASAPTEKGDIKVQLYVQPTALSPLIAQTGFTALTNQLHSDALVGVSGTNEVFGRLAESYEGSADATTWTFHLREDVRWSDGEAFDAEDVIFTIETVANPATGSALTGLFAGVAGVTEFLDGTADSISGVTAPDPYTVEITLSAPNAGFVVNLAEPMVYILPEHVVGELPTDGLAENPYFREPTVGVGPYVFSQWVNDDQIEFVANPEYRTELGADRVYAQFLPTDAALAQLETGDIDYAQVFAASVESVEGMEGVTLHSAEGAGIMGFHTNYTNGKLADVRVRQAILHAIDREAIVEELLNGQGKVINTTIHGPEWAMPEGLDPYEYDPEQAAALLAEAGWDSSTEVRIEFSPGIAEREQLVNIVAAQLQAVGINAVATPLEAAVLAEAIGNDDFDMLISSYGLFNVDPATMNIRLLCSAAGTTNIMDYCNPELDELLLAGVATNDQAEREEIYAEAQRLVNAEVPVFWMYSPNTLAATSDRLQGFEMNSLHTQAFWNAADWTVAS